MAYEVLVPVDGAALAHIQLLHPGALGSKINIHSQQHGLPELNKARIALVGVRENRKDVNHLQESVDFNSIRKNFYSLFPGNWTEPCVDLGDIEKGETVEDTYYALKSIAIDLFKKNCVLIVLGGSQDLTYALYRAFDELDQMVNLVNVDSRFDMGDSSEPITNQSYVGKMIVDKPYNLFNYSNVGFQTYFNPQEEIDLVERLHFDAYRLGNVAADLSLVEPAMRDADIVSFDLGAIHSGALPMKDHVVPNGFDGKEACAIARYAGISDRVSIFGLFEFKNGDQEDRSAMLIAQMLWYFIEGVNYRANENLSDVKNNFFTYQVPIEDEVLIFYKSNKTERWWIELPFISSVNNKLKRHTLLPCTYQDYLKAIDQEYPERWLNARLKNEI
ncbi:formimidoylglutamase [Croceiramulus getboli]|nr:formimidoylglutamase [Flavobacteriaceae bacterium YJPT1-3]